VLGRVDAIVLPGDRETLLSWKRSCEGLEHLGVIIDASRNNRVLTGDAVEIQKNGSPVKVLAVRTDESREIAQQTITALEKKKDWPARP
jgi:acetate kinase